MSELDALDHAGEPVQHPRPEAEAPANGDRATVIVTVDGDLPQVLPALREAGLHVERTLTALSIVVGTVDIDGERAVASLRGVHVEREQTVRTTVARGVEPGASPR
ncbi:hypothetical protein SERN_0904 [Serinibacter arcticus]|uniref:Uncharacterized protein n=1 Tax=Serinibacter arcticus TaxID=1655435 RepID=A0A4Z1E7N1_9MICO|nr:hypothetical protein SERN_0904 [Serinibacter arcticus]